MSNRNTISAEFQSTLPAALQRPSTTEASTTAAPEDGTTPYQLSEDDDHHNSASVATSVPHNDSNIYQQFKTYLASPQSKELVGTVALGTFIFVIGYAFGYKPTIRPIPYQYLYNGDGEYVRNLVVNEEMVESSVSTLLLVVLCVIVVPGLQLAASYFCGLSGDVHTTLCVYWLALPLNELVTWSLKLYVGYLRPNFYSACQPSDDYEYCTAADDNGDSVDAYNLRMSFPSGHASWAFCALTLLTLYLERCFGVSRIQYYKTIDNNSNTNTDTADTTTCVVLQHRQNPFQYRLRSMVCLIPMALAIYIATSRIVDNKHFPADILAGSLLGFAVARFFHPLWFIEPKFSLQ